MSLVKFEPSPKRPPTKFPSSFGFGQVSLEGYQDGVIHRLTSTISQRSTETRYIYPWTYDRKGTRIFLPDSPQNSWHRLWKKETNDEGDVGQLTTYHLSTGSIKEIVPYSNGMRNGITKVYNPVGEIIARENYVNDQLHGESITYGYLGNVQREENYFYGHEDGIWRSYYADGTLQSETLYELGRKVRTLEYNKEGQYEKTVTHRY